VTGVAVVLWDPERAHLDLLRLFMAAEVVVRVALSPDSDGVRLNEEGGRVLEGCVTRVAASGAFCVIAGRHIPVSEIVAVARRHITNVPASDPREARSTE
jgi:hypothetical protein